VTWLYPGWWPRRPVDGCDASLLGDETSELGGVGKGKKVVGRMVD
jgi:hypothetical protein